MPIFRAGMMSSGELSSWQRLAKVRERQTRSHEKASGLMWTWLSQGPECEYGWNTEGDLIYAKKRKSSIGKDGAMSLAGSWRKVSNRQTDSDSRPLESKQMETQREQDPAGCLKTWGSCGQ